MRRVLTLVVGARHHGPFAVMDCFGLRPGDGLLLHREPNNPSDRNAIKLSNITGGFVGYVQREVSWIVASWMDAGYIVSGRIIEEGILTNGKVQRKDDYPTAAIYREGFDETSLESEDAVELEKARVLERAT